MTMSVTAAATALLAAVAGAGAPLSTAALPALLFFDLNRWVNSSEGAEIRVGTPQLLTAFTDPTSFVGWGYPSVWPVCSGGSSSQAAACSGYRMLYQGWHLRNGASDTKLMLLAESCDGVTWMPRAPSDGACALAPNCVAVDGGEEVGVVYDDGPHAPPEERLKALWGNTTITVSADGESWRPFGKWTSKSIDPGISVFRNPLLPEEVVVMSRPQALRSTGGRHAGFHAGLGWSALGTEENERALPLDDLFEPTDQFYGLPSFAYGGLYVVTHVWRYHCPKFPCYQGGFVSSAVGYSYNSRNWSAVGQPPVPRPDAAATPVVPRGPVNNTDISNTRTYSHTYRHFANATEGALACQRECDSDTRCAAWTYVINDTCCGVERCCRHDSRGCPVPRVGCISGARTPGPCVGPSPPPPPPPTVPLPELFPNVNGTAMAGQVYPSTLVDQPDQGRILIHASASTHQHGYVSKTPGTWSSILTFELRRDGFTYLTPSADKTRGSVVTKWLRWLGGDLQLNADCDTSAGAAVSIAVLDGDTGAEVPGYGAADADAFGGNATAQVVTWRRGAEKMSSLAGRVVAFSVTLTSGARIYALRGNFTAADTEGNRRGL